MPHTKYQEFSSAHVTASLGNIKGSLIGLMVGDSIGLPFEGLSSSRLAKINPGPLKHRLVCGRGMVSDDTEHAVMTAQALMGTWGADVKSFKRQLGWRLRWWFMRAPAGVGLATARSIIKLWLGFKDSGVYSAGNGPSMRAPIIGVCLGNEPDKMKAFIRSSTLLTHTDPKAYIAALGVALAAYLSSTEEDTTLENYTAALEPLIMSEDTSSVAEFKLILGLIEKYQDKTPEQFAKALGLGKGISGYSYHTVPVVLFVWLKFQNDYKGGIEVIIKLGGDTDTTAAILGGILGSRCGLQGIPNQWKNGICEWPISIAHVLSSATQLDNCRNSDAPERVPLSNGPMLMLRNLFFFLMILIHGLRRLFPPYR